MKEWLKTHWWTCFFALLGLVVLSEWFGVFNSREMARLAKGTDKAVVVLEEKIQSQDKAVEKIYISTKKKETDDNAAIQKHVENLNGDAVAAELISLLNEYRRERASGD